MNDTTTAKASIRCGSRKHSVPTYHDSVEEVRACCLGNSTAAAKPWAAAHQSHQSATTKQIDFIVSLAEELQVRIGREALADFSKSQASEVIARLLAQKDAQRRAASEANVKDEAKFASYPQVAAGRYAVEIDGTLKFYRVDRPTEGRWAGRTFVKVQASDEYHPVRGLAARAVLEAIEIDPKTAMLRYGKEIGSCGHCGRTLTNEESREAGIGPVCAGKLGW